MMRLMILFFVLFISTTILFAQEYPELTIRDLNYVEDSLLIYWGSLHNEPPQPYLNDTVTVTGVVMNSPYLGADPDSGESLSAGAPACYLQDVSNPEWGGVLLRFPGMPAENEFAFLDTGMVITVTGFPPLYFTTTEFDIIANSFDASNIVGQMQRPKPVPLTITDFFDPVTNEPNYLAEKWEGVYVEFKNVTVVQSNVIGSGTFTFMDENQTIMLSYNKGNYYRSGYTSPLPGTSIERIRGYIETRQQDGFGWFGINPVYPDDIVVGEISPPSIDDVQRDNLFAGYGEEIVITANINDLDETADVTEAKLYYIVTGKAFIEVDMELIDAENGTYSATIPAANDSTIVSYYISSKDADGVESFSPAAADSDPYWYFVLDRSLRIQEVQYIPEWSNFNSLNNKEVTVTGVVTADTSDMPGGVYYDPTVFMQNGAGQWAGIILFGTEAEKLTRGDKVTVTGIVNENFGLTRIGNIEQGVSVVTLEQGVALPEPELLSTDIVADPKMSESYESVLIKFENVTVTDENEDGDPGPNGVGNANYGEAVIADASGLDINLLLDCGGNDYHNFWDPSQEDQPIRITTGDTFESITGIMFFSYSLYKLIPRKNDDFLGHVTAVEEEISTIADSYQLSQNYPNPFNPSTKIQFSMPEAGHVKLNVYNVLGQKIVNLVDEFKNVGSYSVNFDAGNLTSGIYFYEITVNNYSQLKKMMLLK